jgi:DNA-binding transcriptional regulator GbsR (MarR family)
MGEISTQLGASAGSVSTAIKTLSGVGLIERVPSPGSRREHYRFPDNGWARLMSAQNEMVQMMLDAAQSGIDAIGEENTAAGRRLVLMRDFYAYMMRELPTLIDSWYEEHERQRS